MTLFLIRIIVEHLHANTIILRDTNSRLRYLSPCRKELSLLVLALDDANVDLRQSLVSLLRDVLGGATCSLVSIADHVSLDSSLDIQKHVLGLLVDLRSPLLLQS